MFFSVDINVVWKFDEVCSVLWWYFLLSSLSRPLELNSDAYTIQSTTAMGSKYGRFFQFFRICKHVHFVSTVSLEESVDISYRIRCPCDHPDWARSLWRSLVSLMTSLLTSLHNAREEELHQFRTLEKTYTFFSLTFQGAPQYFRGRKDNHSFGAECHEIFTQVNLSTPTVQVVVVVLFFLDDSWLQNPQKKLMILNFTGFFCRQGTHTCICQPQFGIPMDSQFFQVCWKAFWCAISNLADALSLYFIFMSHFVNFRLKTYLGKPYDFVFVKFRLNSKWWF